MARLRRDLGTARSLLWCQAPWRLSGTGLRLGQRVLSLTSGFGWLVELGDRPQLIAGRPGWTSGPGEQIYVDGPVPQAMSTQPRGLAAVRVDIDVRSSRYGAGPVRLLTAAGWASEPDGASGATSQESEAA